MFAIQKFRVCGSEKANKLDFEIVRKLLILKSSYAEIKRKRVVYCIGLSIIRVDKEKLDVFSSKRPVSYNIETLHAYNHKLENSRVSKLDLVFHSI